LQKKREPKPAGDAGTLISKPLPTTTLKIQPNPDRKCKDQETPLKSRAAPMEANTSLDWILGFLALGILGGGLFMLVSGVLSMNQQDPPPK
jgi:hypothetical protein